MKFTDQEIWDAFNDPTKVVKIAYGFGWRDCSNQEELESILKCRYDYCFRICELLPYDTMDGFLDAQLKHGPYLRFVNTPGVVKMPYEVTDNDIKVITGYGFFSETLSYFDLMKNCRWQDGTLCGKIGKDIEE